jgi:hypothetical protein
MNPTGPKIIVDHIDRNPLNNTKKNLRLSDHKKNAQNKSKREGVTSKYFGVWYTKKKRKWNCSVRKDGKSIFNKYVVDEISCARYRDLYILKYLKDEYYNLNFEWSKEDIEYWTNKLNFV